MTISPSGNAAAFTRASTGASGGRLVAATLLAAVVAAAGAAIAPAPALGGESSPVVRKAIRQLLGRDPRARREGERVLLRLGKNVVADLERRIDELRDHLARLLHVAARIEGRPEDDPASDDGVRRFLVAKLEEGWRLLEEGEYERARRIARGLEALDPDSTRVFDYRRLERACQRRMIEHEYLEPSVEFADRLYEVGQTPVIHFRLRNLQARQLVIRARRGVLGTLEITVDRSFIGSTARREVRTIQLRTSDDAGGTERIVLAAHRSFERDIPIELDRPLPPSGMVMRIRAAGTFRPFQLGIGKYNVNESLEVPLAECWVVPPRERRLADDPIRKLEAALIFRDLGTFFTAGQLAVWAAAEEPEMGDRLARLLVGSLDELDEVGFSVADRLLKQLAGMAPNRRADREFWRKWLAERKAARGKRRRTTGRGSAGGRESSRPEILDRRSR